VDLDDLDVAGDLQLYDTDRIRLKAFLEQLSAKIHTQENIGSVCERTFADLQRMGFLARVVPIPIRQGTDIIWGMKITLIMRTEDHDFDYDKQTHEVQHNVIGADQPEVPVSTSVGMPGKLWTPPGT
jgi:hypothetical protein